MVLIKEGEIMKLKMKKIIFTLFLSVFLVFSVTAGAYAYSRIVAFGDSLSDNGNTDGFGFNISSNGPV
jgi:phospholipase/lecithinase/hemolysin